MRFSRISCNPKADTNSVCSFKTKMVDFLRFVLFEDRMESAFLCFPSKDRTSRSCEGFDITMSLLYSLKAL
jgi:hypothetical protein